MGFFLFYIFMIMLFISGYILKHYDGMAIFAYIATFAFGVWAFNWNTNRKNKIHEKTKQHVDSTLKNNGFDFSRIFYKYDNGIALDEKNNRICIFESDDYFEKLKDIKMTIIDYKDILHCEIAEDGQTVIEISRSSQLGGALLGGLLAGGVGAIIGGLSGRQKSTQEVNHITLRIVVNDTENPLYEVDFLSEYVAKKKTSSIYRAMSELATEWHSLISVLIKRADQEDSKNEGSQKQVNGNVHFSVADEIKKLLDLRNQGVLSDKEFEIQKEKLIGV